MRELPILFATDMVRANLAGRKTQTRRILKQDWLRCLTIEDDIEQIIAQCPYGQPGDILWVRETWANLNADFPDMPPHYVYKADLESENQYGPVTWKPSIHMPKAAARIFLQIESVRVQRLINISEDDASAEGIISGTHGFYHDGRGMADDPNKTLRTARFAYGHLWESINGPGSWDKNPWVWVIKYKVLSTIGRPQI